MNSNFTFLLCIAWSLHLDASLAPFLAQHMDTTHKSHSSAQQLITGRWEQKIEALKLASEQIQQKLEDARNQSKKVTEFITQLKRQARERISQPMQKFVTDKTALLGKQYSVLIDQTDELQKQLRVIADILTLLQEQENPHKNIARQPTPLVSGPRAGEKAVSSFDDIVAAQESIESTQTRYGEADKNKAVLADELVQRRKSAALYAEEYASKRIEQEQFSSGTMQKSTHPTLTVAQQGELMDLEEQLARLKRELAADKLHETELKIEYNDLLITKYQLELIDFKKQYARIKKSAQVSSEYVHAVERALQQKKQAVVAEREALSSEIQQLSERRRTIQKEIREAQQKYDIVPAELAAIRALTKEPKTIQEWKAVAKLLNLSVEESLCSVAHEIYTAKLERDKIQLKRDEIEARIVHLWHRMTVRSAQFKSDEEVDQEIKAYTLMKNELEEQYAAVIRAREKVMTDFHEFNVSFDRLQALLTELRRAQYSLFQDASAEYYSILNVFEQLDEKVRRRLDSVSRLMQTYVVAITTLQGAIKKTEGALRELNARSFWMRRESSLTWSDLLTFMPDIERFWQDLAAAGENFFTLEHLALLGQQAIALISEPLRMLLFLVNVALVITCYFLACMYLPDIIIGIARIGQGYWIVQTISLALSAFLSFIMLHLEMVYAWLLCFVLVRLGIITDRFCAQLFYLLSIPIALWLVFLMVKHWREVNKEKRYFLVRESYEKRFFSIVAFMVGILAAIWCVREAFLLSGYVDSRVPVILLAALFIWGQISLIALLGREQLLGVIGSETPLREWIYTHVNRYYYLVCALVIAIIVMSNPYVGYGRQVFYIILRSLITAAFIPFFSWIHSGVKHISMDLFFYYADREVLKERFMTGKFWYGIFIMSSLVLFLAAGIYCGAHLWGFKLTIREMLLWLDHPFYTPLDASGNPVKVTVWSIVYIAMYLLGGYIVAYCVNTFVIARMLDPVIVESGVQNTFLTLSRYLIITLAVFMGLASTGLEGLTTKIAILLAGISFAVQDVVRDFFSYFILLVQRPVKVGDFICVLDGLSTSDNVSLMGFVRSITPRSIVVRKSNSTTLIIPNSRVVLNPIKNWSYTRGFFAFDDMRIVVPYGSDPSVVKQLIAEVLDRNPHILKNPAPIIRLDDFIDNGFSFLVRGFLTSNRIGDQWDIAADVRLNIVKILREQGIEIASPVRTIRIAEPADRAKLLNMFSAQKPPEQEEQPRSEES